MFINSSSFAILSTQRHWRKYLDHNLNKGEKHFGGVEIKCCSEWTVTRSSCLGRVPDFHDYLFNQILLLGMTNYFICQWTFHISQIILECQKAEPGRSASNICRGQVSEVIYYSVIFSLLYEARQLQAIVTIPNMGTSCQSRRSSERIEEILFLLWNLLLLNIWNNFFLRETLQSK